MVIVVHRRLDDADAGTTGGRGVDQRLRAACVDLLDRDQDRTALPLRAHGAPPEGRGTSGRSGSRQPPVAVYAEGSMSDGRQWLGVHCRSRRSVTMSTRAWAAGLTCLFFGRTR